MGGKSEVEQAGIGRGLPPLIQQLLHASEVRLGQGIFAEGGQISQDDVNLS